MSADNPPITKDMLDIYVRTLEKQVQQATLIVKTLEDLHEELEEINAHFNNGLKSEINEHTSGEIEPIVEKIESGLMSVVLIKDNMDRIVDDVKTINEKSHEIADEIKEKISELGSSIEELKSSIKVDKAISIIGWSSFLLSMLTIILRLFGKL